MDKVYILFKTENDQCNKPETEVLGVYFNYKAVKTAMVENKTAGITFAECIGCPRGKCEIDETNISYTVRNACYATFYKLWIEEHKVQ